MDLRSLKKEVHSLADVQKELDNFQENWVKLIRPNTNSDLPSLQNIPLDVREKLNQNLKLSQGKVNQIKYVLNINDKLRCYARYLIELKLTTLRDDQKKAKLIANRMLNDEFLNLKQTIMEVKSFDEHLQQLQSNYEMVNKLLHQELSLEEQLFFMDLPHRKHLHNLLETAQKQKRIVRHLGGHFVSLVKETQLKGR